MPQFLYEQLDGARKMGLLPTGEMPNFIMGNLNSAFELRAYQREAFARFFHCHHNNFEDKEYPLHFLFNMATGSGKTLIMAGLMLYLYEQGYRNFLFFVNSANIIRKTEDNFLNNVSAKYLFNQKLIFDNKEVGVRKADNFEDANKDDITVCFTTIQKLHGDLHNEKEGALTFEDFRDKKIVLLSDEAHHTQVRTRQGTLEGTLGKPNWENTVEKIFRQNNQNLLLEFTATLDFLNREIADKYRNKIIYRYDLKEFRNDGFSKDIELLHTDTDKRERIMQGIILNQYRQEVAGKYGIHLKPVILFKAQRTIEQSRENKLLFHKIIDELAPGDIDAIRVKTNVPVLQNAFQFFKTHDVTDAILARKLKENFAENKCLSVNEDREKEEYQLLLNSLEDKNNQIRAIFAVQKLNEGWDVLNLFDIVRLYDTRDGRENKPGKTTISEAQLIGRGARYFPFEIGEGEDKYKRKFDKNLDDELRILEELHYHSYDEPRYISELKIALEEEGLIDEDEVEVQLSFKDFFKKKRFYTSGLVYRNEQVKTSFENVKSMADLGVSKRNIAYSVTSGLGEETGVFREGRFQEPHAAKSAKDVGLRKIDAHIIKNAMARNDFLSLKI